MLAVVLFVLQAPNKLLSGCSPQSEVVIIESVAKRTKFCASMAA
jgi:hypothetical protein